jgi:hypothetical protein
VRDELGRVADNDMKVEVRIAGCVLFVGWACGLPIASFCHGISFGSLGFVWEAFGPPGLQIAIESSAYEVWPQACNSPSQGGNFEGMRLLLGVAYVQPRNRTQTVLSLAAEWAAETIQVRAASEARAGDET